MYHDRYKKTVAGWEIYYSIWKSKQKKKTKKVLLGDSVGNQLFPNTSHTDTINSLACNQSIGLIGNFLLLNNYLKAGNEIDTAYLLFSPFTFQNNLNQLFTFHYFLKPFYTDEYKGLFSQTVNDQIAKIPFTALCRNPFILTSNWAPHFIPEDNKGFTFLSPISGDYLQRMKALSEAHNFKLIIIPAPLSEIKKPLIEKINKDEIKKYNLSEEFEGYFDKIVYLDNNLFLDGVHFKNPDLYGPYYSKQFIR